MKHLYSTCRIAALLLLLGLSACQSDRLTDDETASGSGTCEGQPISFGTTLTETGADVSTRSGPAPFPQVGMTMTVTMKVDEAGYEQTADYVYTAEGWVTAEGSSPLRWQNPSSRHAFFAGIPAMTAEEHAAGINTVGHWRIWRLPTVFTEENYRQYDYLYGEAANDSPTPQIIFILDHEYERIEVIERPGYEVTIPNVVTKHTNGVDEVSTIRLWDDHGIYRGYHMKRRSYVGHSVFLRSSYGREVELKDEYIPGLNTKNSSLLIDLAHGLVSGNSADEINAQLSVLTDDRLTDEMIVVRGPVDADGIRAILTLGQNSPWDVDLREATGLTELPEGAFNEAYKLRSLLLPESVTTVGDGAFNGCSGLEYIELPGVRSIGKNVFTDCSFTLIRLPMLEQTDSRAFDSESLITLILPRIKRFGKLALQNGYGEYSDLANLVTDGSQEVMVEDDGEPGPGGLGAPPNLRNLFLTSPAIRTEADIKPCWRNLWKWNHIYYKYNGVGEVTNPASYAERYTRPYD